MASVEIAKKNLSSQFPDWFKPEPGFKFRDSDGDPCMIIGWGGWRKGESMVVDTPFGQLSGNYLEFRPCELLCTYHYKGEWNMQAVDDEIMKAACPGWSLDDEKRFGGWE